MYAKREAGNRARRCESGSASVEMVAAVPVIVIFILTAFQLSCTISHAILGVADANAYAESALRAWEYQNSGSGFTRPCIENMETTVFKSTPTQFNVGMGVLSKILETEQEVSIVQYPICTP